MLEKRHCLQHHTLPSFDGITLEEDDSFPATSLATLIAMVEEDLGVALLPLIAVEAGIIKGHTVNLADVQGARPREVALTWCRSAPNADLFHKIGTCLKSVQRG